MAQQTESLTELPPSAKLVYKVLEVEGKMTQHEIADASLLPVRTVRHALGRLEAAEIVEEGVYFRDARKSLYSLREPFETDGGVVTDDK